MGNHKAVTKSVSVIIVNYGTAALALQAVESVLDRSHGAYAVDVHLVDNRGPGDDAALLRAAHAERGWADRVTLYIEDSNLGFGRGNNVALDALAARAAPPDYIFFLNPDARLDNGAIEILADFLEDNPRAAIAGAAIVREHGSRVPAAFRFPGFASEFAQAAAFAPLARLFSRRLVALPPDMGRQQVDWVSGAGFMSRFSTLLQCGPFDPDFFLYFEETELMWRIRRAGHEIWYVPEARIEHAAGAATGLQGGRRRNGPLPSYWYDSWRLYNLKTRGRAGTLAMGLVRMAGGCVNVVQRGLRGRRPDLPARFFRDFGRHVLRPLLGPGSAGQVHGRAPVRPQSETPS